MKSLQLSIALIITVVAVQFAFAGDIEWKELDAFHTVMSETFHPAEEGNLQPVRDNAAELLTKAKEWQMAPVPEGYDKELTAKTLKTLVAKCKGLKSAVKAKKNDKELTKLITEAHDVFHKIVEECKTSSDEHKHSDDHKH